jgi:hypothetical protein
MSTDRNHHSYAQRCAAMAERAQDGSDKALWLTLAQKILSRPAVCASTAPIDESMRKHQIGADAAGDRE